MALEIRRTADGKVLARRLDGLPLTPEDRATVKAQAMAEDLPPRAWVFEEVRSKSGELRAVKIASEPLDDFLWVLWDRSFQPADGLAVYFGEEMEALKKKSIEELREVHKTKLAFPGARVVQ